MGFTYQVLFSRSFFSFQFVEKEGLGFPSLTGMGGRRRGRIWSGDCTSFFLARRFPKESGRKSGYSDPIEDRMFRNVGRHGSRNVEMGKVETAKTKQNTVSVGAFSFMLCCCY